MFALPVLFPSPANLSLSPRAGGVPILVRWLFDAPCLLPLMVARPLTPGPFVVEFYQNTRTSGGRAAKVGPSAAGLLGASAGAHT